MGSEAENLPELTDDNETYGGYQCRRGKQKHDEPRDHDMSWDRRRRCDPENDWIDSTHTAIWPSSDRYSTDQVSTIVMSVVIKGWTSPTRCHRSTALRDQQATHRNRMIDGWLIVSRHRGVEALLRDRNRCIAPVLIQNSRLIGRPRECLQHIFTKDRKSVV